MEPVILVNPLDHQSYLVTNAVEEHRLRSAGYHEPKPEPADEPEVEVVPVEDIWLRSIAPEVEVVDESADPVVVVKPAPSKKNT